MQLHHDIILKLNHIFSYCADVLENVVNVDEGEYDALIDKYDQVINEIESIINEIPTDENDFHKICHEFTKSLLLSMVLSRKIWISLKGKAELTKKYGLFEYWKDVRQRNKAIKKRQILGTELNNKYRHVYG